MHDNESTIKFPHKFRKYFYSSSPAFMEHSSQITSDVSTIVKIENVEISLPLWQYALSATQLGLVGYALSDTLPGLVGVSVITNYPGCNPLGPFVSRLETSGVNI
ncbi:hypothetical protein HD554DRAFT_2042451 [Boletus coccyginus]|nr:hypothetical protein HD554DRAFT_2042451 [Boletus coccyginus]